MSLRSINTIWGSTHTRYTGLAEMGCWDVWCNDYTPYIGMFLSLSTSVRGWSLFVMWWGRCVGWHPMRRGCSSCSKFRETRGRSSLQRRGYVTWLWYGANHVHWPTDLVSCPRQVDHMHQLEHPPANCWCILVHVTFFLAVDACLSWSFAIYYRIRCAGWPLEFDQFSG